MYKSVASLAESKVPLTLIVAAGFEDRASRSAKLLLKEGVPICRALILTYDGPEHHKNLELITDALSLLPQPIEFTTLRIEINSLREFIAKLDRVRDKIVLDVTGLSRIFMMVLLSDILAKKISCEILYTEAEEYYPSRQDFEQLTHGAESEEAFFNLSEYENSEVMYSKNCVVEEIPGMEGRILPNYPLMLITFLTFKRARVSAILQAYEANIRILVKGVPRRNDLKWRAQAITLPNLDLIEDSTLYELDTLDWRTTYDFLATLYENDNNKYKFNFVLAPLGSKMQTIGAWVFGKAHDEVKMVTSTPKTLFPERYSVGFGDTFLIDNVFDLLDPREAAGE